jgi:hypothetical protein
MITKDKLLEQRAKVSAREKILRDYIVKHKIKFFGNYDPKLDERFSDLKLKGPNPRQKQILEAWKNPLYKIFTFTGSNRLGKTVLGTIIAISTLFGEWLWSGEKLNFMHKKPRKVRYIGQDWEEHIKTVVEPAIKEWWPADRPLETKKNNQGINAQWIDKITDSELLIMSNKQDTSTHEGWEGDLVVYDEPPKRDIFIANSRGLVDRVGRQLFCMTLIKEAWVHREVIKRMENGKPDPAVFNVVGEIYDNIGYGLTMEGVKDFAKTLKEDEKEARLRGKPSYLSGLIFPKFDRTVHVKPRFKIPLDWIVDIMIDWHPSKAWHVLFLATDQINRKWVIDEIVQKTNYKYMVEEIVRRINKQKLRIENPILGDPLMKSGSQGDIDEETVFDKMNDLFYQFGYSIVNASKDENSGIDLINEYLITQTGEPAFFVFDDCGTTIKHIEDWMWVDGKPAKDNEDMCENLYRGMLINTQYRPLVIKHKETEPVNWKVI